MQGMFEINIAAAVEAQDWIKEYMQAVMNENEATNIRIHCRLRWEGYHKLVLEHDIYGTVQCDHNCASGYTGP